MNKKGMVNVNGYGDYICENERGFVLVAAMSALVILSLIGIAAMNTSNMEKQIAQNVNLLEKTFYGSDGGTEAAVEVIEFNLSCPLGFTGTNLDENNLDPDVFYDIGGVRIADPLLAYRDSFLELPADWGVLDPVLRPALEDKGYTGIIPHASPPTDPDIESIYHSVIPGDLIRNIMIPENTANPTDNAPHINIAFFGAATPGEGNALQMASGYEGRGGGAGGGGAVRQYLDFAEDIGLSNSRATIRIGWSHLIGTEGECRPH